MNHLLPIINEDDDNFTPSINMDNIMKRILGSDDDNFVSEVNMDNIMEKILQSNDDIIEKLDDLDKPINIEEYALADEEIEFGKYVNMINIFTCYFKKLFERKESDNLFAGINIEVEDSTNKSLEFLYDEIIKFNSSMEDDKDILYDPDDDLLDINNCKELYILCVDHSPLYACKFLLPLLQYLGGENWLEMEWNIMPLKN